MLRLSTKHLVGRFLYHPSTLKRQAIMREVEIDTQDIIDAIKTLVITNRAQCDWITDWLPEEQMLSWAKASLSMKNARANADALSWAKRAVCARIDRFLKLCLLSDVAPKEYPRRIQLLREVGIDLPDVVYEFIIKPRNDLEHLYMLPPDISVAKNAVEIAQLSLGATNDYLTFSCKCCGRIALNCNIQFSRRSGHYSFSNETMIFADVFTEPIKIKVIDPISCECRFAFLSSFEREKAIELSVLFNQRPAYVEEESGYPPEYFIAAKKELGF